MKVVTVGGFAIFDDGTIDILTVYEHERGAKVNWLVVRKGVVPRESWTDDLIEQWWQIMRGTADCVPVQISTIAAHNRGRSREKASDAS
jgi:hypothetical protein